MIRSVYERNYKQQFDKGIQKETRDYGYLSEKNIDCGKTCEFMGTNVRREKKRS